MPVEPGGQLDEGTGVDGVGSEWSVAAGHLLNAHDTRRGLVVVGVDEDDQPCGGDVVGEFGRELLVRFDACTGQPPVGSEHLRDPRAEGIVAAQRVAVPDDEDAVGVHRANSSTTAPSGPISCSRNAIWPRAWVEQLRHGS